MELDELKFLKDNRKYLRSKITRSCNHVSSQVGDYDLQMSNNVISDLKELREKLNVSNMEISKGIWKHESDRAILDGELAKCDEYDARIVEAVRSLEVRIEGVPVVIPAGPSSELTRVGN